MRVAALLTFVMILSPAAFAHDVTLSGNVKFTFLDGSADDHDGAVNGVFTVHDGNLTVNGTVSCSDDAPAPASDSACAMAFAVSGNVTVNAGGALVAENNRGNGTGGNITLTVGGNLVLNGPAGGGAGALISSGSAGTTAAGAITANVGGGVTLAGGSVVSAASKGDASAAISIVAGGQLAASGLIASGPTRTVLATKLVGAVLESGTANQRGGAITLRSTGFTEPGVTIGVDAVVASQGEKDNAGPVNLEACGVVVRGLVASVVGKSNATASVVIRSGKDILIDSQSLGGAGTGLARLRADSLDDDAGNNRIDLFAKETIQILGPAAGSLYSVSSSPAKKKTAGGTVRVISTEDAITISGRAISAGLNDDENEGGRIDVLAKGDVLMNTANLAAVGDYSKLKTGAKGGTINVRSHSGNIVWTSGVGDVRPAGSGAPAAAQGSITLTACGTITTSGSSFPTTGPAVGPFPTTQTGACSPAAPSLPIGVTLPTCNTPPVANDANATTNEDNSVTITLTATDADGDPLTFSIVSGPANGMLSAITPLGPNSAQVTYTPDADYFGPDSFTFEVNDGNGGTDQGVVSITVNPVNDPPTFSTGPNVSSDEDAGPQTFDPWATSISAGPANESGQNVNFVVIGNSNPSLFSAGPQVSPTGVLTYTSAPDASGPANLTIQLVDDGGTANGGNDTSGPQTFSIVINAVNDAPVVNAATFSVDENSANGTVVGNVTFSDVDSGQTHTYAITAGNTNGAFAVDSSTGQITVANSAALNYEVTTSFPLTVTVTDNGSPALSGSNTITINVNDKNDAPVVYAATFSVDENSANGTNVGTVNATDEDAGQTLSYAIIAGNTGGAFAINASTGQITVAAALNFENIASYSLTVTATDNGSPALTGSNTITVNVDDLNEAPVVSSATFNVAENSANGTSVGTVTFNDQDGGQTHTFAITGGNTGGAFAINASTGEITVANSAALNYEAGPTTYSLTVEVTDNGSPVMSGTATITISVTDVNETPAPTGGPFSVAENRAIGSVVGTVAANDPDAGQSHTWMITAGNTGGAFAINAGGVITVANPAAINYEAVQTFTLTVQATDNGAPALSGSTTVIVNVTNVNEGPTAGKDSYTYFGNTELRIAGHAGNATAVTFTTNATNLLANDVDPDGPGSGFENITVIPASGTTVNGSRYAIAANGTMVYTPGPGFAGAESIPYTISDGANSANGSINFTFTPNDMTWYVQNTAVAPFEGTSTHPFNMLSAAQSASGANHIIYVLKGDGSAYSSIALKNGQKLWGEGVNLVMNSATLITGSPANRPLLSTAGNTVEVIANVANGDRTGVQIRGLILNSAGGNAITGSTADANTLGLLISDNVVSGSGIGFDGISVDGNSSGSVTLAVDNNSITSGGKAIDANRFLGNYTVTSLQNNVVVDSAASGIVFNGPMTFDAIPGGALNNVAGGATSIGVAGNGVALSGLVLNSITGSLTFTSLNVYSDGGTGVSIIGNGPFTGAAGTQVGAGSGTIAANGGAAVDASNFTSAFTLTSVSSTNSASRGLNLVNVAGRFQTAGGAITNAALTDFEIIGGTANVSYGGSISDDLGTLVDVNNTTGGTKTFSGAINDGNDGDGSGVTLTHNTGATINFSGPLTLSTGANAAFVAGGGGTVSASNTSSTITTTTGVAVNVSVTIGSAGMVFRSVSSNGAPNAILLTNTGSGAFTVGGDGTSARNGSGGAINNSGSDAIRLTNANNVTLRSMNLTNNGSNPLSAADAQGIAGNHTVEINGGSNVVLGGVYIQGTRGTGVLALNAGGTNRINSNSRFEDSLAGAGHGIYVNNTTVNGAFELDNMQMVDSAASHANAFFVNGAAANLQVDIKNGSVFEDLATQAVTLAAGGQIATTGTFISNVVGNFFRNAKGNGENNLGILVNNGATHVGLAQNNLFDNVARDGNVANTSIIRTQNSGGVLDATVRLNVVQNIAYLTGGRHVIGHIFEPIVFSAASASNLVIDGNTVNNVTYTGTNREAVFIDYRPTASGGEVSIVNNNFNMPTAGNQQAMELRFRQTNPSTVNLLVSGNTVSTNTTAPQVDVDSEAAATINTTISSNVINNPNGAPGQQIDVASEAATSSLCANITGNTLLSGAGRITVNETAGTVNVTQASATALASANGIPAANVTIIGAPAFGQPACALP